ncbi:MAG: hypothetical protein Q4F13_06915 [Pseudomonadota bacterium]|nr:hypothetical protein [Pseudomonadota bacterium]
MPSVQRFFSGRHNLVRTAQLAASSVRAATATQRVGARRTGGGRVRLGGSYTGHEADTVQVRLAAGGGAPRASVPQFAGVGNGALAVQGVDAAAPLQTLTLTLADLGVPTAHAQLDVREVGIRARAPGAAGNQIRIHIEPRLARTPTAWALLADWATGTAVQTGPQWDFGGLPLGAGGALDEATGRIQLGDDPQIYRPWRQYKDGAWQFGLSPALQRNVAAGTPVYAVTGGYVVTVTDGAVSEVFGDTGAGQAAIVTFYDLLTALQTSALVDVAGVVAADRTAGGQAAVDVPLRTQAWLMAQGGKVRLQDVGVPAGAPTQNLTVRCINADTVGAERWSVTGDVSGALDVAVTGQPYVSAAASFTVPRIEPQSVGSGRVSFVFSPTQRGEAEGTPSVCARPLQLGRNAVARKVTFRYVRRPPADCACSDMPELYLPMECLGLEGNMSMEHAAVKQRMEAMYVWREAFVRANTSASSPTSPSQPGAAPPDTVVFYAQQRDIDWANAALRILADCLQRVYAHGQALAAWDALWTEVQADLAPLSSYELSAGSAAGAVIQVSPANPRYLDRYRAAVDNILLKAGLRPKSESSATDAGGCWTDHGGTHWWVDVDGHFLPAFTNQAYISSRRDADTGRVYSTQEFGFGLVVACPERLKAGDEVTLHIEAVDGQRPYQVGDEATLSTVAAGAAWLAGGVDGTDVQTWRVAGSASGALPDYVVPTGGAPVPQYQAAGITLAMQPGGIPFVLGDAFTLAVEAGQYQWRRGGDSGAWSALHDIPPSGQAALADGLVAYFDVGAAPSFVPGDDYTFAVHQPWAASHVRDAQASAWGWAGDGGRMVVDLGAPQRIEAVALARYALPAGAQASIALSDDGAAWGAEVALDCTRAVCVHMLGAASRTARYLRLSVSGAPGGHVGWLWAGVPLACDHHASTCQRQRRWAASRGDGVNPAALYAGAGDGWRLAWQPGDAQASRLLDADVQALLALADWAQAQDEPLIFVPHWRHPQDAALVRLGSDALEVSDEHAWQPDDAGHRLLSAQLDLEPVYA